MDNNILDLACTVNNTHTFSGLSSTGSYRILIIYKKSFICNGLGQCGLLIDQTDIVISATSLANVCGFIQSQHNSGQSAIVKREGNIEISCNIQNNKITDLQASQKITAFPGSRSGTGSGTFFHAKIISSCSKSGKKILDTKKNVTDKELSPDDYIQKIKNEFDNSKLTPNFTIYPNPTQGKFTLTIKAINSNSLVEVYDIMGKKIWRKTVSKDKTQIDITTQPKGIYLVKVVNGNKIFTQKVIYE